MGQEQALRGVEAPLQFKLDFYHPLQTSRPPDPVHCSAHPLPTLMSTITAGPPSATWFQKWLPPYIRSSYAGLCHPSAVWALDSPVGLGGEGEGPSFNCLHLIFYFIHIFSD